MSQGSALLLTIAAELPWYVAMLVALRLTKFWRATVLAVVANLLTHPVLWWALGEHPPTIRIAGAEVLVWLAETGLIWLAVRREPALIALVAGAANAGSILAGALIAGAS